MLLFFSAGMLLAVAVMINAVYALQSRLANLLAIVGLFFGQIILLTIILSELHQIGRTGFLVGQGLLLAAVFALWYREKPSPRWWFSFSELRQHKWLTLFALGVLGIALISLVMPTLYLTLDGDGYSYHLPRAYFWQQNATTHHFFTTMVFMNEHPPNPSYYFLWGMVMGVSEQGLQIFQWVAGLVTALTAAGWVRLAGHGRAAAVFTALMSLTLPMTIVQMGMIEIDLLTSMAGFSFLYFAFYSLQAHQRGIPLSKNYAIAYTGITFGIFMGSKLTAFFFLPGVGIAVLIYALVLFKKDALRPLAALFISGISGFLILGSYNYILNMLDFGNPISSLSREAGAANVDPNNPAFYSQKGNLFRLTYMLMDWALLPDGENILSKTHTQIYQILDEQLNLNLEAVWKFDLADYGSGRRSPSRTGYGVIGYLTFLASPVLLIFFSIRARHSIPSLFSALYILIGWAWLITFVIIVLWDPFRMRYFSLVLIPMLAAIFPWLYTGRWRTLIVPPLMILALVTGFDAAWKGFDRQEIQNLRQTYQYEAAILKNTLPAASKIGFIDPLLPYYVISQLPDYDYTFIPFDEAESKLDRVDAELAYTLYDDLGCFQDRASYVLRLPLLGYCVYVPDAEAARQNFQQAYGFDTGTARQPANLIADYGDFWRVHVLSDALKHEHRVIHIQAVSAINRVTCNQHDTPFYVNSGELLIYLPADNRIPNTLFQTCDVYGSADVQQIQLTSDTPPPPEVSFDLRFNNRFIFNGFVMPFGYESTACAALPIITWWQPIADIREDYNLSITLVDESENVVAALDAPFARTGDRVDGDFFNRQLLPISCELPSGLYNIKIGLYDPASVQSYTITGADGTSQGTGVHLTTIFVR